MLCLKCYTIDPSGCADAHLQNADEQNMDASSNSSSVKYLEKELLVLCQGKEEKYPVELMEWVDEESMSAFLAADEELSTVATDEELNEAITDEWGVKYSKDERKLLKAPYELNGTYSIRKGTKIICDGSFCHCESLESIVIPDSVTSIGNRAFNECDSLRSVVISDGVTSIGDGAFQFCSSLNDIIIPDSVTSIGIYAFGECTSLSSLVISDSVTSIGNWAFYYCDALRSVVIPDGVTSIGVGAFIGCKSLKSLEIPDSVTSIGFGAFSYCYFPYKLKQELISRFGDKIFGN